MSFGIVKTTSVFVCPAEERLAQVLRAAAPRPPHKAAQGSSAKERASRSNSASWGCERSPPGVGLLDPWERRIEWFPTFSEVVFVAGFLSCPLRFSSYMEGDFSGDGTLSSPPLGILLRIPKLFWLSGRAPDSVRTGQWFEPRLSSFVRYGFFSFLFSRSIAQLCDVQGSSVVRAPPFSLL